MSSIPIAVAPMAASYSSSPVFTDGVLADSVDWDALGSRATAAPRLRDLLLTLNIVDLPRPKNYFGAERLFGRKLIDSDAADDGEDDGIDMIREVRRQFKEIPGLL